MSAYDFAGLVSGLAGVWLFLASAVIAALAALRLAAVRRRPGQGRIARGALAFAVVVGLAGLALVVAADFTPFRRSLDRHAGTIVGAIVTAGLAAALRAARRREAPAATAPAPAVAPAAPVAADDPTTPPR